MQTKQLSQIKYEQYLEDTMVSENNRKTKQRVVNDYLQLLCDKGVEVTISKAKDVEDYLTTLDYLNPSTYNHYVSVLRDFYHYLYRSKLIAIDWGEHLLYKKAPRLLPRNIPLQLMLQLCTPTAEEEVAIKTSLFAIRDQAIIEFLFSTGVRSAELLDAKLKDLSYDMSQCFIPTKKKGVPRYVYLGAPAREWLSFYLKKRGITALTQLSKDERESNLFLNKYNNGLSYTSLREIVINCAQKRIATKVTPHMFRHTFATEMLRSGGCLRSLQILLGHTSIASTQKYCHLDIKDRATAINDFHPMSQENLTTD